MCQNEKGRRNWYTLRWSSLKVQESKPLDCGEDFNRGEDCPAIYIVDIARCTCNSPISVQRMMDNGLDKWWMQICHCTGIHRCILHHGCADVVMIDWPGTSSQMYKFRIRILHFKAAGYRTEMMDVPWSWWMEMSLRTVPLGVDPDLRHQKGKKTGKRCCGMQPQEQVRRRRTIKYAGQL